MILGSPRIFLDSILIKCMLLRFAICVFLTFFSGLYTNHSVAREGVRLGIPIQCVCTWNGAAIVRAAPFLGTNSHVVCPSFLAPYNLKFCWKPSVLLNKSHEKYERYVVICCAA